MKALKALKSRREGIEKIGKIVRAMEAIASTRLHRYEAELLKFRPFALAQKEIIKHLALRLKKMRSFWTETQEDQKGIAILFSSEQGFCGGFNNQLFRLIEDLKEKNSSLSFLAIGRKGAAYIKRHQFNLIEEFTFPQLAKRPDFAQEIGSKIVDFYLKAKNKVYLIFNEYRRHLLGRGKIRQIFPLVPQEQEGKELVLDYLFEPASEVVIDKMVRSYVNSEIMTAVSESQAAEEMARMVAMTQARRNVEDLIKKLTQQYHKARQAGITRELVEISNIQFS